MLQPPDLMQNTTITMRLVTNEYVVIDNYQLFIIVTKHIPALKQEVENILQQANK